MARFKLVRGQEINARVVEIISHGELICEYEGTLFRVVNESTKTFQAGSSIPLIVRSENPIVLQIRSKKPSMDRFV